jgi:invasion protein IalB
MALASGEALAQPNKPAAAPALATAASPQAAPVGAGPESSTETYGDWALICGGVAVASGKVCEVDATISLKNQQTQQATPIARVAFASLGKDRPFHAVVQTPNNVTIAPGVKLEPEEGKGALTLVFRACAPTGCFAEGDLTMDQVKRFRDRSAPARVAFTDAGGKPVVLPVSLRGFDQAMDALAKR